MIRLRGITWNHTRGHTPLAACGQRFGELHPEVEVTWNRRSLLEFGETPVEQLAEHFDLLVIDHPFIGFAAAKGVFHALDGLVSPDLLGDWRKATVGQSTASYQYGRRTWAAPIDAACPIALWREDRLARLGGAVPATWEEMLQLAGRGAVIAPGIHTDMMQHFFMLLVAFGAEPGATDGVLAPEETSAHALDVLGQLFAKLPERCRRMNPIAVHEELAAAGGDAAYCPFAFGYSNYARRGYAAHRLRAGTPPAWNGRPLRTVLGGTGLAISARTAAPDWAARFVAFTSSTDTQRGLYWQSGGQPGHRAAWIDDLNNADCNGYLRATLPVLDAAWVRPRFPGYVFFQDHAAHVVHRAVGREMTIPAAVSRINALWREARQQCRLYEY